MGKKWFQVLGGERRRCRGRAVAARWPHKGRSVAAAVGLSLAVLGVDVQGASIGQVLAHWTFPPSKREAWATSGIKTAVQPEPNGLPCFPGLGRAPLWIHARRVSGRRNFSPTKGAVRLILRPKWATRFSSMVVGMPAGKGPGKPACLLAIGYRSGTQLVSWVRLETDSEGRWLRVLQRTSSGWRTNLTVQIHWPYQMALGMSSGGIPVNHEVIFQYSPSLVQLIVDGTLKTDRSSRSSRGRGLGRLPQGVEWVLSVGSRLDGSAPMQGWIQEVTTLDGEVCPFQTRVYWNWYGVSATVETNPPAIRLSTYNYTHRPVPIRRREAEETQWQTLAPRFSNSVFVDQDSKLRLDQSYDYQVQNKTIRVPILKRPVRRWGKVLVLVDETVRSRIQSELDQFLRDLAGDGWEVRVASAPRHPDRAWSSSPIDPEYQRRLRRVRSLIQSEKQGLRAIILLGHVVIPFTGAGAEDGHPEHFGAWPADAYYGDLDTEWPDQKIDTARIRIRIRSGMRKNVPGDGKFDPITVRDLVRATGEKEPVLEAAVGRIDFANLPCLGRDGEIKALRQYLRKNHAYRTGQLQFAPKMRVGTFFGNSWHPAARVIYANATAIATRFFPDPEAAVSFGTAFQSNDSGSYLWVLIGGYGGASALHNSARMNRMFGIQRCSSQDLIQQPPGVQGAFYLLKGSYFGEWTGRDNFLRALLAAPDRALAVFFTMSDLWQWARPAAGEPIGTAMIDSARGMADLRLLYILGDPTLKAFVATPPRNVQIQRTSQGVRITWQRGSPATIGYCVERSDHGPLGPWRSIGADRIHSSSFVDFNLPQRDTWYRVRAIEQTQSGSGIWENVSCGVLGKP